jgi:Uma2 family endonuclease
MSIDLRDDQTPTLADLLEQLGGISPRRVLLKPPPGKATEKDLLRHMDRTGRPCELVEGTLVEKAMGYNESDIAAELLMHMRQHAKKHKLGRVTGEAATMRLMPRLVRLPDVAFVRQDRFPGGQLPDEPIPDLFPDLAVEVLSKSNTAGEIRRKLKEYFLAGTTLAWIVDPKKRQVVVHTAPDVFTVLTEKDTLHGGDLLPGFTLAVAGLFEDLPPPRKRPATPKKKP